MTDLKKQTILDMKAGNVIKKNIRDKVILIGSHLDKGSTYADNVEIIINPGDESRPIITKVDYSGYNLELFLGDFNNDGLDEIMLRGAYGGTGGFAITVIYTYENGILEEIFNPKIFSEQYEFNARYLEDYMVEVSSKILREKYTFYIGNKPKVYLNEIYDENGHIRKDESPTVSAINNSFPIKSVYEDIYYLFIRQRVVGVSNADTIGFIESFVNLVDNEITIFSIGSFEFGEKINNTNKRSGSEIVNKEKDNIESIAEGSDFSVSNVVEESEKIKRDSKERKTEEFIIDDEIRQRDIITIKTADSVFIDFYDKKYGTLDFIEKNSELKRGEKEEVSLIEESNKELKESNKILNEDILKVKAKGEVPKYVVDKFPIDTIFIDLENKFDYRDFGNEELKNERNREIIVPYVLNNSPYIGVIEENKEDYLLKSNFRGEGFTVEELIVKKIGEEFYVFVGFKIKKDLNKLYILKLRGGRLTKAFDDNEHYYTKMYLKDLNDDCTYELILWTKKDDGGYYISIYNVKESGLKVTNKYDKKYYKEVVDYYKGKIDSYENNTIYPYYLALAYEKRGEYKKALAVVDKVLENESPYPSRAELENLRKRLKKK